MPRRPRRTGRRRRNNNTIGRRIDRRVGLYSQTGSQLYKDVKWLMSMVNVETKYIDTLFNANTMTNNIGNQSLLNGCTQGNSASTRSGQSTKAVKCILDFIVSVGVTTPVNCRICLILDKASNGSTVGVGSIFQAAVDGASDYTTSQRNVATVGSRILFLYDYAFSLDTVQNTSRVIKSVVKLNFHTKYNTGNAGTIADISENSLYLLCMSNAGATQPTFKGSVRFEFTDN